MNLPHWYAGMSWVDMECFRYQMGSAFLMFVRYMGLYDIPRCDMGVLSSLICLGMEGVQNI
jgi:hypothetical protein